jgi:hypothetical protein
MWSARSDIKTSHRITGDETVGNQPKMYSLGRPAYIEAPRCECDPIRSPVCFGGAPPLVTAPWLVTLTKSAPTQARRCPKVGRYCVVVGGQVFQAGQCSHSEDCPITCQGRLPTRPVWRVISTAPFLLLRRYRDLHTPCRAAVEQRRTTRHAQNRDLESYFAVDVPAYEVQGNFAESVGRKNTCLP